MKMRLVLVDHHEIVREGLISLMRDEPDIEVIGQASDGFAALRLAKELRPDVMLMDISLPGLNGIEATRRIRECHANIRVLCLSMHEAAREVFAAMDAGAAGYALKNRSYEELIQGIRTIAANQTYLSPTLVHMFVDRYRTRGTQLERGGVRLTPREREFVQLVSEGYSTQQIAQQLHISIKTVATHRENVLSKLNINGIAQLTRYAIREGITSLELGSPASEAVHVEISSDRFATRAQLAGMTERKRRA
jgi:DNA-binding NarL/FixJ family response regulator